MITEREFFSQVVVQLPDGRSTTVRDVAEDAIVHGGGLLAGGLSILLPRLPPPAERP